jgi:hypothetical protein
MIIVSRTARRLDLANENLYLWKDFYATVALGRNDVEIVEYYMELRMNDGICAPICSHCLRVNLRLYVR